MAALPATAELERVSALPATAELRRVRALPATPTLARVEALPEIPRSSSRLLAIRRESAMFVPARVG